LRPGTAALTISAGNGKANQLDPNTTFDVSLSAINTYTGATIVNGGIAAL
jgi:autotransporter-associated beta strand protein